MAAAVVTAFGTLLKEVSATLFPSICVVCDAQLPWRERKASCCGVCWGALPRITSAKCLRCAIPWAGGTEGEAFVCIECSGGDMPLDWSEAWGHYRGGLERLVHALKFERHDFLAPPLGMLMAAVHAGRSDDDFDAIVPVPLHRRRMRERGYNQAELLARTVSRMSGIRLDTRLLRRSREGAPQATLKRAERAANVRNAYASSGRAEGLSLLVVDDVSTTGATLRACAGALRRAGARRVCALTLARA
jgi:ComF family protein